MTPHSATTRRSGSDGTHCRATKWAARTRDTLKEFNKTSSLLCFELLHCLLDRVYALDIGSKRGRRHRGVLDAGLPAQLEV